MFLVQLIGFPPCHHRLHQEQRRFVLTYLETVSFSVGQGRLNQLATQYFDSN